MYLNLVSYEDNSELRWAHRNLINIFQHHFMTMVLALSYLVIAIEVIPYYFGYRPTFVKSEGRIIQQNYSKSCRNFPFGNLVF